MNGDVSSRAQDREIPGDRQCEIFWSDTACLKLRDIFGTTFPANKILRRKQVTSRSVSFYF